MTEFFMPMIPPTKTHQEKKVRVVKGKPVFYEPAELKAVRSKLEAHLAKYVPEEKYTGAIRLTSKWLFPITGNHTDGEWKITKPDTDNMVKTPKDVMTKLGYWTDDCLVASEIIEKFWANMPGIYIKIEELG
jgi:Holliday junction resolvase RusA-like endonuclease